MGLTIENTGCKFDYQEFECTDSFDGIELRKIGYNDGRICTVNEWKRSGKSIDSDQEWSGVKWSEVKWVDYHTRTLQEEDCFKYTTCEWVHASKQNDKIDFVTVLVKHSHARFSRYSNEIGLGFSETMYNIAVISLLGKSGTVRKFIQWIPVFGFCRSSQGANAKNQGKC